MSSATSNRVGFLVEKVRGSICNIVRARTRPLGYGASLHEARLRVRVIRFMAILVLAWPASSEA
jgi:hypothetical protein